MFCMHPFSFKFLRIINIQIKITKAHHILTIKGIHLVGFLESSVTIGLAFDCHFASRNHGPGS